MLFLICSISESLASPFLPFLNNVMLGSIDASVGKPIFTKKTYLEDNDTENIFGQ